MSEENQKSFITQQMIKVFVGLAIIAIVTIGVVDGLSYYRDYKSGKDIEKTKTEIEGQFEVLTTLIENKDTVGRVLDSSETEIITTLQEYRDLINTNHYEKDSALIYINNIHIDSLLSGLPELPSVSGHTEDPEPCGRPDSIQVQSPGS